MDHRLFEQVNVFCVYEDEKQHFSSAHKQQERGKKRIKQLVVFSIKDIEGD